MRLGCVFDFDYELFNLCERDFGLKVGVKGQRHFYPSEVSDPTSGVCVILNLLLEEHFRHELCLF